MHVIYIKNVRCVYVPCLNNIILYYARSNKGKLGLHHDIHIIMNEVERLDIYLHEDESLDYSLSSSSRFVRRILCVEEVGHRHQQKVVRTHYPSSVKGTADCCGRGCDLYDVRITS